jgi:hypothetical protein
LHAVEGMLSVRVHRRSSAGRVRNGSQRAGADGERAARLPRSNPQIAVARARLVTSAVPGSRRSGLVVMGALPATGKTAVASSAPSPDHRHARLDDAAAPLLAGWPC